ncbi:MAG: acyltransferase, partial [Proteobacteria bacterium]|nr:acyltransferase [Pseudomonadota bacterium]
MTPYSREELLALGFESVGADVMVSRDVRFFAISGSLGDRVRIDTYCIVTGQVELGADVHIAPLCFLSATGG